jgi:hypothetical protein
MDPLTFVGALMIFCRMTDGSVTSWGRTKKHNKDVGGVARSAHRAFLGADVVYDVPIAEEEATDYAERLGLRLIREGDHDHLQPLGWRKG